MTPDFTLIWPLSCLKDGVHLCHAGRVPRRGHSAPSRLARAPAGTADGVHETARPLAKDRAFTNTPGGDLLSHTVAHAVPSAVEGLTAVFGMGTGVTPLLCPPGTLGAGSSALDARGQPHFEERSLHRREPCATTEYPTNDSSQPLAPSAARPAPAMYTEIIWTSLTAD